MEVNLEVLKGSIGLIIVKNMFGSWNVVEMLIIGEIITNSGFAEVTLEILKTPIVLDIVEKIIRIWNQAKMSISGKIITAK